MQFGLVGLDYWVGESRDIAKRVLVPVIKVLNRTMQRKNRIARARLKTFRVLSKLLAMPLRERLECFLLLEFLIQNLAKVY